MYISIVYLYRVLSIVVGSLHIHTKEYTYTHTFWSTFCTLWIIRLNKQCLTISWVLFSSPSVKILIVSAGYNERVINAMAYIICTYSGMYVHCIQIIDLFMIIMLLGCFLSLSKYQLESNARQTCANAQSSVYNFNSSNFWCTQKQSQTVVRASVVHFGFKIIEIIHLVYVCCLWYTLVYPYTPLYASSFHLKLSMTVLLQQLGMSIGSITAPLRSWLGLLLQTLTLHIITVTVQPEFK